MASICIPAVHHDRNLLVGLVEDGVEAVEAADAAGEEPGAGHVFVADEIFCLWQFQFGGRAADEDIVLRAVRLRLPFARSRFSPVPRLLMTSAARGASDRSFLQQIINPNGDR